MNEKQWQRFVRLKSNTVTYYLAKASLTVQQPVVALANTTGFHIVNELCIANFSGYTDDSRSPKPSM